MDPINRLLFGFLNRAKRHSLNRSIFRKTLPGMGIGWYGDLDHTGEKAFLQAFLPRLRDRPVIIDVGANRGLYAEAVRAIRPDARIIAFEPNPRILPELKRLAQTADIEIVEAAAGENAERVWLFDDPSDRSGEGASLSSAVIEGREHTDVRSVEISVIRLDNWLEDQALARVDFLKIDAEGHDLGVIRGLGDHRPDVICFEFSEANVATRTFMKDFHGALPGYRFHRLVVDGLVPLGDYDALYWEIFRWNNVVCLREDGPMIDLACIFE